MKFYNPKLKTQNPKLITRNVGQGSQNLEQTSGEVTSYKLQVTKRRGFTLVELMVAVSIFAIVMTISAGIMVSIIDANKKSRALQSVMNNLNFAVESMTRTMMFGTKYHCALTNDTSGEVEPAYMFAQNCPNTPSNEMSFVHNDGTRTIIYRFDESSGQLQVAQIAQGQTSSPSFIGVTSSEIKIEKMQFIVDGAGVEAGLLQKQPRVLITISGYAGTTEKEISRFNLQTSVSQRTLDQ